MRPASEEVADQPAHVIGLLVDDPEELEHLGRVEGRRGAEHGGGRALDGGQRGAQLVAHHAQELGAQPLALVEIGEVLHGHDDRLDAAVVVADRGRVDQDPDAPAVGDGELDLFGADRLGAAQLLGQGEFLEGDLAPVGAPARHDPEQLVDGAVRRAQAADHAPRLAVEPRRTAGADVEDNDAHRGRVDQGLQVGAGALLLPVRPGVGDRRRRLRGEEHQDLFVLARELLSAVLAGEEEVADVRAPVTQRRALQGLRRQQVGGQAERAGVAAHVAEPQRSRQRPQVLEEPRPFRPVRQPPVFFGGRARGDEVADPPVVVEGGDAAVPGPGQGAAALDDLAQDGVEVEAGADAEDGRAQPRDAVPQRLVLPPQVLGTVRRVARWYRWSGRTPGCCHSRSLLGAEAC